MRNRICRWHSRDRIRKNKELIVETERKLTELLKGNPTAFMGVDLAQGDSLHGNIVFRTGSNPVLM